MKRRFCKKNSTVEKLNVAETTKLNLCLSCEICSAVCPTGAIAMENKLGQFLPQIDNEKCTRCGLCLEACPGIDVDPSALRHKKISESASFDGPCLEAYTAHSNDLKIRKNSASGGLITTLIIELIKNKEFDAVFVLIFDKFDGRPARLKATNDVNEIYSAARSKYIPASMYNVIKTLKHDPSKRYIIVATPCLTYGIKKVMKKNNIPEENVLFLGLFCEKTLNFNIVRYFEDAYGKSNEKLTKFQFKTKEKHGWPGHSKIYFDSGRELIVNRQVRMLAKRFFQLNRCLFCLDKLNRLADISFGDCYIDGKSGFHGKSSVIIRTEMGKEIFSKYSNLFTLEGESIEEIRRSQHLMEKKNNLDYIKILVKQNDFFHDNVSDYRTNSQVARELLKLQKYISWGESYDLNKIRLVLFSSKIVGKLRKIVGKLRTIKCELQMAGGLLVKWFLARPNNKDHISRKTAKGNVVVVGGELFNKGAQAMTFTVVDQIRRRLPDKNIYLFSSVDFKREDSEKCIYKFDILPWALETREGLLSLRNKFTQYNESDCPESKIRKVLRNTDFIIDISGYALSSQWGLWKSFGYLLNILIAKKYSIAYYIFPQSIGPFDYSVKNKILLYPLLRLYLKYPIKIFPREKEGLRCVSKFTRGNVEKGHDIVLQNDRYKLKNVFNKDIYFRDIKIESNSIGIIPNLRVLEQTSPGEMYAVYCSLVTKLIDAKKTVYILRHSYEDLGMCREIKSRYGDSKSVKLITDDLNAIELEHIMKQFDFVIASRFHSIVHAYRNRIPALVIGWATKYFELLEDFDQLDYFFDCRSGLIVEEINVSLDKMIHNYKYEKEKINHKMALVTKRNTFDIFGTVKC